MREFWIAHPACQSEPVGFVRWAKWHLAERLSGWARKLEWEALHPNCRDCGNPRNRGDHSDCFEPPF